MTVTTGMLIDGKVSMDAVAMEKTPRTQARGQREWESARRAALMSSSPSPASTAVCQ